MNTYTKALNSKKEAHRTTRNILSPKIALMIAVLMLLTVTAIAASMGNQSVIAIGKSPAVSYSNALEMQYAQPWLNAQNKPSVAYGNALEFQYAQPWLVAQNKAAAAYGNALEMQYARPWLAAQNKPVVAYSNALELQYAQPWLNKSGLPIDCSGSIEMLYACQYGYGRP